jgi:uncharacterized RDD family membrane protein YckC
MKLQNDAPLTHRILAFIFDASVVAALQIAVTNAVISFLRSGESRPFELAFIPLFASALGMLYFLVPTLFLGGTFGKRLLGIRVSALDGNDLSKGRVILRETLGRYFGIFVVGWAWAFFTEKRRTAWDFIGKSWVTQDEEPSPSRFITAFLVITASVLWVFKASTPYLFPSSSPLITSSYRSNPGDQIVVSRAEANRLTSMETELLSQADFIPVIEEEMLVGYRVDSIRKGSDLEKLGLKNNDLLCGVDDDIEKVTDPDRAREVLFSLPGTQALSVCIVRNGEERSLIYEIHD